MNTPDRPFAAILDSQPAGLRLSGGAALVLVSYVALMLAGLGPSARSEPPARTPAPASRELVVTLFDQPPPVQLAAAGGEVPSAATAPRVAARVAPSLRARRDKPVALQPAAATVAPATPAVAKIETPPQPAAAAAPSGEVGAVSGAAPAAASGAVGGGAPATRTGTDTGAAAAASGSSVLAFRDGMTRPQLIDMTPPQYTREAREADVKGLFLAKCVITTAGSLQNCRVVKGLPHMDRAVLTALARWRYTPVIFQGKPVAVDYVIQVRLAGP